MDEREQTREQTEQVLERLREIQHPIQRKRLWSRSPLEWLLLWQLQKAERHLQEGLAASEGAQENGDDEDNDEDSEDSCSSSFFILQLAPSLPFRVSFPVPFSRHRIQIGKDSLERLRWRTRLSPEDADAHITLAAHLISEEPVLPVHAEEAARHLQTALGLMPPDEDLGDKAQTKAMTHSFLGDALLVLGKRSEARHHWERTVALDPVTPPHGFSGPAQERLDKYPA